ncbi:MAG: DUF4760 domain-containing protein [Hyphomicrobiaceae bacterium]
MNIFADILTKPEALATVLSIGSGVLLGTYGFVWNSIQEKKKYTFDMLMKYTENTAIIMALHHVWKHISRTKSYDPTRLDDELERHVTLLLSYFQSVAVAANNRMLNEKILLIARYGSMKTIWDFFHPYIEQKRRQLDRPLLYVDLEDFLRKHDGKYRRYRKAYENRAIRPPSTSAIAQ